MFCFLRRIEIGKMAPVKKPPKNAFSFYMDEHIPRLRAEGINIGHKESRENNKKI